MSLCHKSTLLTAGLAAAVVLAWPASAPATTFPANISPDAIELSERERIALEAVRDRTTSLDETALYMMLAKAGKRAEPVSPAYRDLLAHPGRYRGEAIRLTLQVDTVRKLLPEEGLPVTPYWPKDRPVWRLECLNPAAGRPRDEPVVVLSVVAPTLLPRPDQIADNGDQLFHEPGPMIELTGVFYKVYQARTRGDARDPAAWRDFPVIVAWQLAPVAGHGTDWRQSRTILIVLIILAAGLAVLFLRRLIKHQARPRLAQLPRRAAAPSTDQQDAGRGPEENAEIDPLLKEAAEDYRRKRQSGDGKDNQG